MSRGGFVVRFDGKLAARCYRVSFDYDHWHYRTNDDPAQELPANLESITVEVEEE
jgi:hypothetical protein